MQREYLPRANSRRRLHTWTTRREQMKRISPKDLRIIGVDTKHEAGEHELWDERAFNKPSAAFIASVKANGVLQPIFATKKDLFVVDGRTRTLGGRLAKCDTVPVILLNGESEAEQIEMMILLNELRTEDPLHVRAAKAVRALTKCEKEDVARAFGISTKQLGNYVKFTELSSKVKKAVTDGKLKLTAATKLSGMPSAEQNEALDALLSGKAKPTGKAASNAKKRKRGAKVPMSKKEVKKLAVLMGFGTGTNDAEKTDPEVQAAFRKSGVHIDFLWGQMYQEGDYDVVSEYPDFGEVVKLLRK
jgi:ParB-like chromosome segregation protein Spo0J